MHQTRSPKPKNGFHSVGESCRGPILPKEKQSHAYGNENRHVLREVFPIEIDGVFVAFPG